MTKIVHLIPSLEFGGAEMMLSKITGSMSREKFQNVVVSITPDTCLKSQFQAAGTPVYSLDVARGSISLPALLRFKQILRREKPDILQTWLYHADLLGLLGTCFTDRPALLWNIRCSDMDLNKYSLLSLLVFRILILSSKRPWGILANSRAGLNWHKEQGYDPKRWMVIENGFDIDKFAPSILARRSIIQELDISDDSVLIGLIARFDPMKDHDTFFKAAAILAERHADVNFILAGKSIASTNSELMRMVRLYRMQNRVFLLGERTDIPEITAALDIATSSSITEGFSNTIGEAMSCEVPCVVTDVGDSAYLVADTGIVAPPSNPQSLADGWDKLICLGSEGRKKLGRKARERIIEHFSLPTIIAKYEALYEEVSTNVRHSRLY